MLKQIIIIFSLLLLLGCGSKTENTTDVNPDRELVRAASAKLIQKFSSELKGELMTAVKEGGLAEAIGVCSNNAPEIAATYSQNGWTIKRISEKNRNSENLAGESDLSVLKLFSDSLTMAYHEVWDEKDNQKLYKYYKPIKTGKLCLNCHGTSDDIAPEVRTVLDELYPNDLAVDYKEGDLRGMFVVEAIWPDGRDYAEQLVSDSI